MKKLIIDSLVASLKLSPLFVSSALLSSFFVDDSKTWWAIMMAILPMYAYLAQKIVEGI